MQGPAWSQARRGWALWSEAVEGSIKYEGIEWCRPGAENFPCHGFVRSKQAMQRRNKGSVQFTRIFAAQTSLPFSRPHWPSLLLKGAALPCYNQGTGTWSDRTVQAQQGSPLCQSEGGLGLGSLSFWPEPALLQLCASGEAGWPFSPCANGALSGGVTLPPLSSLTRTRTASGLKSP